MNISKRHSGALLGLGIAFVALGTFAIYSVVFATVASVLFFGWLLLFSGFIQMGHGFFARNWNGFLLQILMGALSLIAGIFIVFNPLAGALSLTLLLSLFFMFQGITRIIFALQKRPGHWKWVLLSGIMALLLGIFIFYEWPYSGLYIIGLFVGIDFILNGWALIALSMQSRKKTERAPATHQG